MNAEPRYVGFWARVLASLIDTVLLGLVIYPVAYAVYGDAYFEISGQLVQGPVDALLQYVLPLIVVILFWIYRSATPGKMILKAKIVDAETLGKPARWQWVVRYLGYYVSLLAFCLGFLWVGWDPRKQGFHDKMAGTVVIYDQAG
ncbi:MAG: RDD family protein [Halieaceae bacterium]